MQYKIDNNIGYTPETLQQILDELNELFEDVFGANWNTEISSSNGQFIMDLANIQVNNQNFIQYLYEVWNPNTSSGVFLESLCALLSIYKKPPTASTVIVTCYGSVNTQIRSGSQIINTATNDIFRTNGGSIGSTGSVDLTFNALEVGAINVDADITWSIINNIAGWTSASNSIKGNVGLEIQSDNSLRSNRTQLLAISGAGYIDSMYANLYELSGVKSVKVLENADSVNTLPVGTTGLFMQQNSVFIVVNSDKLPATYQSIAQVIQRKKPAGIDQNQAFLVIDPFNMKSVTFEIQLPQKYSDGITPVTQPFTAYFYEAQQRNIQLNVTIIDINKNLVASAIAQALLDNWNGVDPFSTYSKPILNEIIDISRFIPTLLGLKAGIITTFTIGLLGQFPQSSYIQLPIIEIATLALQDIRVTILPPLITR